MADTKHTDDDHAELVDSHHKAMAHAHPHIDRDPDSAAQRILRAVAHQTAGLETRVAQLERTKAAK